MPMIGPCRRSARDRSPWSPAKLAISDTSGDMVHGAVHGLIHDDRRYLDIWSLRLAGHELRPLAATTPTPFSAVFIARVHELGGRPLPVLVIRRRSVGRGIVK